MSKEYRADQGYEPSAPYNGAPAGYHEHDVFGHEENHQVSYAAFEL